jgi:hypothetical protein
MGPTPCQFLRAGGSSGITPYSNKWRAFSIEERLFTGGSGRLSDSTDDEANDGKRGDGIVTGGYEGRSSDSLGRIGSGSVWAFAASKVKESKGRSSLLCVAGSAGSSESLAGRTASEKTENSATEGTDSPGVDTGGSGKEMEDRETAGGVGNSVSAGCTGSGQASPDEEISVAIAIGTARRGVAVSGVGDALVSEDFLEVPDSVESMVTELDGSYTEGEVPFLMESTNLTSTPSILDISLKSAGDFTGVKDEGR